MSWLPDWTATEPNPAPALSSGWADDEPTGPRSEPGPEDNWAALAGSWSADGRTWTRRGFDWLAGALATAYRPDLPPPPSEVVAPVTGRDRRRSAPDRPLFTEDPVR